MTTAGTRAKDAMQGVGVESGRSMASGLKSQDDPDKGYTELYKLNQVWYRTPPQLSLASKRTGLINQAQRYNYTNPTQDVITFIFNSGEYYVNPKTSYLYFEIGYNSQVAFSQVQAYISQGNIMSIFDEIVFMSSSGTEINREQNKGLNSAAKWRWTHDQQYIDTYGQVQGAALGPYSRIYDGNGPSGQNPNLPGLGPGGATLPKGGTGGRAFFGYGLHNINSMPNLSTASGLLPFTGLGYASFIIPLNQILGCFMPYMDCLLPAGLLAGGRLEMRLKNPLEFLQITVPTSPVATSTAALASMVANSSSALTINKIYINFDAFQLSDAVIKRLVEVAATSEGLTMMFDTYDYTPTPQVGTGVAEASVTQARSRIVRSWCMLRENANETNPYVNSLASEAAVIRTTQSILPGQAATGAPSADYVPGGMNTMLITATTGVADAVANYVGEYVTLKTPFPADPNFLANQTVWGQPVVATYQAQLGSLFFPQQPITTTAEQYTNALFMFCKSQIDQKDNCAVTYEDFLGGRGINSSATTSPWAPIIPTQANAIVAPIVFPYGCALYGMLAEKSSILQLSGLPISNSRLLRHKFTITFPTQSGSPRTIHVFTEYTRVIKVFLGGRVVVRE